ncbi:MAG: PGF-CTERM sorting domain-containing protein, partial [archaeon]
DSVETNDPVTAGETLNATVNLSNTGDITGNQTVMLYLDNQSMDARAISLGPNESTTVTLAYRSNAWTTGELNLSAATGDDREAFHAVVEDETEESTDAASESSGPTTDASESGVTADSSTSDATTDSSTSDSDRDGQTNDTTPGFGVVPALIALVAALGVARFRRDAK